MPALYIPTNIAIDGIGGIANVKGTARATAIVAVSPGIAPTTIPIATPITAKSTFWRVNIRLNPVINCSHISILSFFNL